MVSLLRDRQTPSGEPRDPALSLHEEQRRNALAALDRLKKMGYCDGCALDAASALLRARFAELVT
jgi:hypothetical protein